jgi:tetratricopeptide (TPR) repeat protein
MYDTHSNSIDYQNMKKLLSPLKVLIVFIFLLFTEVSVLANYLNEGIALFEKDKLEKSKILFERTLVFDPKSEQSYLYLAKIYNKKNNDESEEINLNSVLLINPKNDEAIYMLTLLKIKQSDYESAKKLIEKLNLVCKSFCSKEAELQEKLKMLSPDNAKSNN